MEASSPWAPLEIEARPANEIRAAAELRPAIELRPEAEWLPPAELQSETGLQAPEIFPQPPAMPAPVQPAAAAQLPAALYSPEMTEAEQEAAMLAYVDSILLGTPPPRAQRRHLPFVAQEAEDEPTFHISIGHLEVIAPQPVKLPRRRRQAPNLSLQDYLDKRRVGRG